MATNKPETRTLELSPMEVSAIVLCAEENHRQMLHMAEIKSDPIGVNTLKLGRRFAVSSRAPMS